MLTWDSGQPGRDRIRIALEGHQGTGSDGVALLDGRRITGGRQRPQSFEFGQISHTRSPPSPCGQERDGGLLADEIFEFGDRALAACRRSVRRSGRVGAAPRRWSSPSWCARSAAWRSGWTSPHFPCDCPAGADRPRRSTLVLGHRDEARLHHAGLRFDDGRHAVSAPAPGVATQSAEHRVHGFDQVRLVL